MIIRYELKLFLVIKQIDHLISYKGLLISIYNSNILQRNEIGMVLWTNGSTTVIKRDQKSPQFEENEAPIIQTASVYLH